MRELVAHDCVQVERDCVDLHKALAAAIARIEAVNRLSYWQRAIRHVAYADLFEVLDRTSRSAAES